MGQSEQCTLYTVEKRGSVRALYIIYSREEVGQSEHCTLYTVEKRWGSQSSVRYIQ